MSERHIPVLLDEVIAALNPQSGERIIDGTFGAGGYAQAVLATPGALVLGIDRDPSAIAAGKAAGHDRLHLAFGTYDDMEALASAHDFAPVHGVMLDIGVSSMQIDDAARGFSFQKDGPLDMRMSAEGPSAADVVNTASEALLADILFHYGEERKARPIARAILRDRRSVPFERTTQLVATIESVLGKGIPGRIHPATRSFQALRIFVNDELGQLSRGLAAADRLLAPDGRLAVVTFHSLEDRIVKRFMQERCGRQAGPSRHLPQTAQTPPSFSPITKGAEEPSDAETARNPRARSAKLRAARRTSAPAWADASANSFLAPITTGEWKR
jgi:16S rRNA (cytosine1402-N4)-methyltransferase